MSAKIKGRYCTREIPVLTVKIALADRVTDRFVFEKLHISGFIDRHPLKAEHAKRIKID